MDSSGSRSGRYQRTPAVRYHKTLLSAAHLGIGRVQGDIAETVEPTREVQRPQLCFIADRPGAIRVHQNKVEASVPPAILPQPHETKKSCVRFFKTPYLVSDILKNKKNATTTFCKYGKTNQASDSSSCSTDRSIQQSWQYTCVSCGAYAAHDSLSSI